LLIAACISALCEQSPIDYGAEFAAHSDSLAYRTIGIYVFLRTVMCSRSSKPDRARVEAGPAYPWCGVSMD